jgi:hypothetical protein
MGEMVILGERLWMVVLTMGVDDNVVEKRGRDIIRRIEVLNQHESSYESDAFVGTILVVRMKETAEVLSPVDRPL